MGNIHSERERSYEIDLFKGEILRLMDHYVNDIFAEIIRATDDFSNLKNILADLNSSDTRNDYNLSGSTTEEVLEANSVDKKFNYVQFKKAFEVKEILKSWRVNLDMKSEVILLREIRNRLSHYDRENKYKNIDMVYEDLFTIQCFLFNFKLKFPDKYDAFLLKHEEIIQKTKDFADKYNEKTMITLKSNKISIEEYCRELQNDIFYGSSMEEIERRLYIAICDLRIDITDGKFMKIEKNNILKYFYKTKENKTPSSEPNNLESSTSTGILRLSSSLISDAEIRRIIRDYNILVDYRCLTSQTVRSFLEKRLIPILVSSGRRGKLMYIYDALNNYFQLNSNNKHNDEIIKFIKSNMKMELYGYLKADLDDPSDDAQIIDIICNKYNDNPFCIVTDNQNLMRELYKIKDDGLLILNVRDKFSDNQNQNREKINRDNSVKKNGFDINVPKKEEFKPLFKLSKTCFADTNTQLEISHIPGKDDEVYTLKEKKAIKLIDFINGGGEGSIFSTSEPGIVAKIYFEKCITQNRKDKLILMTEHQPNISNVCWPIDIILNKHGEFVGYIMLQAHGKDMAKTIFKGKCGKFNRSELVECLINIFETISKLHKNNILLGDINGGNILINSSQEIYFVDTDSYQIEQYPCPVGTELFTPPEIFKSENGDFSKFLRSPEDERYALGVLAFMTIIPGATPYPMIEGKFKNGFRFPQNGKKAEGKLTYNCIWSHIYYQVKQLFWKVFDDNDRTVSAENWILALNNYKRDIGDDQIKNEIFITTYKDTSGDTFVTEKCPKCNMPLNITQEEYNRRASNGRQVWCRACTTMNNHIRNLTTFITCSKCNRRLCVSKTEYDNIISITCDRCNKSLKVSAKEYEKRKNRGWDILCFDCDSNMGFKDTGICCSECDSENGLKIRYAVPTLSEIITLLE